MMMTKSMDKIKFEIYKFDRLDSTNNQAHRIEYKHGSVIVCNDQYEGRGQRGNVWVSEKNENLNCSIVLNPIHIKVAESFKILMITALAASDMLIDEGINCTIKWPNDLYVENKKIGGILIENASMGEFILKSIVGIGINVNQKVFSEKIPNPTSMKIERKIDNNTEIILEKLLRKIETRYYDENNNIGDHYCKRLWRRNGPHKFVDAGGEFLAEINNVNQLTGEITLLRSEGIKSKYMFKEVEFVL